MILCSRLPLLDANNATCFSFRLKAVVLHDHQAQQFYFQVLVPKFRTQILDPPQTPCSEVLVLRVYPPEILVSPRFQHMDSRSPKIL